MLWEERAILGATTEKNALGGKNSARGISDHTSPIAWLNANYQGTRIVLDQTLFNQIGNESPQHLLRIDGKIIGEVECALTVALLQKGITTSCLTGFQVEAVIVRSLQLREFFQHAALYLGRGHIQAAGRLHCNIMFTLESAVDLLADLSELCPRSAHLDNCLHDHAEVAS